jgi:Mn-dependent DtxR family transcriptional regulator
VNSEKANVSKIATALSITEKTVTENLSRLIS